MTEIMAQLTALSGLGREWFLAAFMVFLRVGAMMALLPAFGEQTIPARVRLVLALAFAAVTMPAVVDRIPTMTSPLPFLTEVLAGLLLGIGLRLFVHALQIAGTIIAQSTSLSQLFGGIDADPLPVLGTILTVAGLALAMALGLHVRVAEMIILSYDILPAGGIPLAVDVADWGTGQIGHIFALAFSLSAPFMIASLIYNLALGVINRAMPQLMVAMIGAPALTLGGLALFAIMAPLALGVWVAAMGEFLTAPMVSPR